MVGKDAKKSLYNPQREKREKLFIDAMLWEADEMMAADPSVETEGVQGHDSALLIQRSDGSRWQSNENYTDINAGEYGLTDIGKEFKTTLETQLRENPLMTQIMGNIEQEWINRQMHEWKNSAEGKAALQNTELVRYEMNKDHPAYESTVIPDYSDNYDGQQDSMDSDNGKKFIYVTPSRSKELELQADVAKGEHLQDPKFQTQMQELLETALRDNTKAGWMQKDRSGRGLDVGQPTLQKVIAEAAKNLDSHKAATQNWLVAVVKRVIMKISLWLTARSASSALNTAFATFPKSLDVSVDPEHKAKITAKAQGVLDNLTDSYVLLSKQLEDAQEYNEKKGFAQEGRRWCGVVDETLAADLTALQGQVKLAQLGLMVAKGETALNKKDTYEAISGEDLQKLYKAAQEEICGRKQDDEALNEPTEVQKRDIADHMYTAAFVGKPKMQQVEVIADNQAQYPGMEEGIRINVFDRNEDGQIQTDGKPMLDAAAIEQVKAETAATMRERNQKKGMLWGRKPGTSISSTVGEKLNKGPEGRDVGSLFDI